MFAFIELAWKEFWLPFFYRKSGACPGGRDFVWLSTFLILILTLMLLLSGSREGLLNRFVDIFIGKTRDHGVPVWVTTNMFKKGGLNAIDSSVLSEIKTLSKSRIQGIEVHPYRSIERINTYVSLPDNEIWKNRREDGTSLGPDFNGLAVYPDDPLWKPYFTTRPLPLEIVINRTYFIKYFDYEKYRNTLKNILPGALFRKLPEKLDKKQLPGELWLEISNGRSNEIFPFKAKWVDRFPVIQKIVFLFPLPTYHALEAAYRYPDLRYFPEKKGKQGTRATEIRLIIDPDKPETKKDEHLYKRFASKLGGELSKYYGDMIIKLKQPVRTSWVDAYAREFNLTYKINSSIESDKIEYTNGKLKLPCSRLNRINDPICNKDEFHPVETDVTAQGNGFLNALVYVPDRRVLSDAVNYLLKIKDNALSIHPSYQDALKKFGFLSEIITALQHPYTIFLVIFIFSVLGIQIATLINHRRIRYGIFLAKGIIWWQIYTMVFLQIFMAGVMGILTSVIAINWVRSYLRETIQSVAIKYRETVYIADFDMLPLTLWDYGAAFFIVLVFAWLIAIFFLFFMPIRLRTQPGDLLY